MERRRALVVAGTVTATLAMAGTAMAVNLGLLGSSSDSVGDLTATDVQPVAEVRSNSARPRIRVVVQDVPVAAGTNGGGSSTGSAESDRTSSEPAPTPIFDDHSDDGFDDDGFDDDAGGDDHADDGAADPEDPADDD